MSRLLHIKAIATIRQNNPLLLFLLLAGDFFFIFMFGLLGLNIIRDTGFSLIHDQTYSEIYQYIKFFWLVLCFSFLIYTTREYLYGLFAVAFSFLLLDDYFQIHEYSGGVIARALNIPDTTMLEAVHFGELLVFAIYGVLFLPMFAVMYRSSSANVRRHAVVLIGFVAALAFFAVVVDLLHGLKLPFVIRHTIGAIEDGGELLVISGMFWYVYSMANHSGADVGQRT